MFLFIFPFVIFAPVDTLISIHLMFLFIVIADYFTLEIEVISIHLMFLFILLEDIRQLLHRISIHLMFLFIEEKKDGKSKKSEFQYISCSYLSIVGLHNTTHRGNFNTSHVLIYLLIYARFVCWKDISIHLMFLFIV